MDATGKNLKLSQLKRLPQELKVFLASGSRFL